MSKLVRYSGLGSAAVIALVVAAFTFSSALADGTVDFIGQGTTLTNGVRVLNTIQCSGDTAQPGSILWVFTVAGADSATITINGTTYAMTQSGQGTFKYVSGWYNLTTVVASGTYIGTVSGNPQLVISHGCPPAQVSWCSPGFWAQNQTRLAGSAFDISGLIGTAYNTIGGAPLKKGAPSNPTIGDVLASPQTYGGPAFNSVANYLSAHFGWSGTQATGENCPIDAFGNLK
jgi:hypothetical protein